MNVQANPAPTTIKRLFADLCSKELCVISPLMTRNENVINVSSLEFWLPEVITIPGCVFFPTCLLDILSYIAAKAVVQLPIFYKTNPSSKH